MSATDNAAPMWTILREASWITVRRTLRAMAHNRWDSSSDIAIAEPPSIDDDGLPADVVRSRRCQKERGADDILWNSGAAERHAGVDLLAPECLRRDGRMRCFDADHAGSDSVHADTPGRPLH